jgi:hypothetical protein
LEYLGIGFATEIALEITRYQEIRVLLADTREPAATCRGYRCPIRAEWRQFKPDGTA